MQPRKGPENWGVGVVGGTKCIREGKSEGCFIFTSWLIGAFGLLKCLWSACVGQFVKGLYNII